MVVRTKKDSRPAEAALGILPAKRVTEYRRGQIIYNEAHPPEGLYLVLRGRVKISVTMEDGAEVVTGIFGADDFIGESGLLGLTGHRECATVLEGAALMAWTTAEIEALIEARPQLGIALMQVLVERCQDFKDRLQSIALDKTPERVALCLIRFARRLGTPGSDGSEHIPPFTHQLLSDYLGTSREVVTFQMNHFRQKGYLRYSRKGIEVYPDTLAEHLQRPDRQQP